MNTKSIAVAVIVLVLSTSTHAAFIGRLPATPGGDDYQAYYDTQLKITWLADANASAGSAFDDGTSTTDGTMSWANANAWAASLNINGITGWRLPNVDVDGDGTFVHCGYFTQSVTQAECMDNEYAHIFSFGAGKIFGRGITPVNPGPFSNVLDSVYWAGNESDSDPLDAWHVAFFTEFGFQLSMALKVFPDHAWAVYDGDVSAVPVPAAVWVFSSGLLGLIGFTRHKA